MPGDSKKRLRRELRPGRQKLLKAVHGPGRQKLLKELQGPGRQELLKAVQGRGGRFSREAMRRDHMANTIISLSDIRKSYGKHEVLKGVSLEIEEGQIYGLIGKNGAGKSTIFKVILGLSDYSAGKLHVGAAGDDLEKGRSRIGFLVGNNYFSYANAEQNLQYYARLKGIKEPKKEIERVLEAVDLKGVKKKVGSYSLGMRQRLGIANAMLGNPKILILDEPTNGLDPQGIADIRNLLKSLNEQYGMTIIVSSHILGELQNTAHKFAILNDGVVARVLDQSELSSPENMVDLRIHAEDLDKAKEALASAGIDLLDTVVETRSLEDFYFALIGGGKNA